MNLTNSAQTWSTEACRSSMENAIFTWSVQKLKFSIKNFFSKCDKIDRKLRIWSHLLKKSLMKNFIFLHSPSENGIFHIWLHASVDQKNFPDFNIYNLATHSGFWTFSPSPWNKLKDNNFGKTFIERALRHIFETKALPYYVKASIFLFTYILSDLKWYFPKF